MPPVAPVSSTVEPEIRMCSQTTTCTVTMPFPGRDTATVPDDPNAISMSPSAPLAPGEVIALFGPTGVGKTAVAVALAARLRAIGEHPVAVSADAAGIQRAGDHRRVAPSGPRWSA
jgi:Mrp family chromosome partitioning ATPase